MGAHLACYGVARVAGGPRPSRIEGGTPGALDIRTPGDTGWPPTADRKQDVDHYRRTMDALWRIPQCMGYHLCGAYIHNNARRYGFRDRTNAVIPETVEGIRSVNVDFLRRITGESGI
jgi:hypothetical protein